MFKTKFSDYKPQGFIFIITNIKGTLQNNKQDRDVSESVTFLGLKSNILATQIIGFAGSQVKRFGQS